jgi:hypothetical protein
VEVPDRDNVQCRAPRLVRPDGLATAFRAPAPSTGSSVSRVGRFAPEVLERARYSAGADVLDGLDGLGYWR